MGQTNTLFVCQGLGCCSLSSAPTDQHVKANLKLAMIKNICSNTADASLLIKPSLCQSLTRRPQTWMKDMLVWTTVARLQDEPHFAQNSLPMHIHGGENEPQKSVFGDKSNGTFNKHKKEGIMVRSFPSFPAWGAENRMLQSLPGLADKRTQTDDALDDFWKMYF